MLFHLLIAPINTKHREKVFPIQMNVNDECKFIAKASTIVELGYSKINIKHVLIMLRQSIHIIKFALSEENPISINITLRDEILISLYFSL